MSSSAERLGRGGGDSGVGLDATILEPEAGGSVEAFFFFFLPVRAEFNDSIDALEVELDVDEDLEAFFPSSSSDGNPTSGTASC